MGAVAASKPPVVGLDEPLPCCEAKQSSRAPASPCPQKKGCSHSTPDRLMSSQLHAGRLLALRAFPRSTVNRATRQHGKPPPAETRKEWKTKGANCEPCCLATPPAHAHSIRHSSLVPWVFSSRCWREASFAARHKLLLDLTERFRRASSGSNFVAFFCRLVLFLVTDVLSQAKGAREQNERA